MLTNSPRGTVTAKLKWLDAVNPRLAANLRSGFYSQIWETLMVAGKMHTLALSHPAAQRSWGPTSPSNCLQGRASEHERRTNDRTRSGAAGVYVHYYDRSTFMGVSTMHDTAGLISEPSNGRHRNTHKHYCCAGRHSCARHVGGSTHTCGSIPKGQRAVAGRHQS